MFTIEAENQTMVNSDAVTYGKSRTLPVFPGATKTQDPGPGIGFYIKNI